MLARIGRSHAAARPWIEFAVVTGWGLALALLVLRQTLALPGFLVVRDTTPIFYSHSLYIASFTDPVSDSISYLDNSLVPPGALLLCGILSPTAFQRVLLVLFPFVTGTVSMYYGCQYFLTKYATLGQSTGKPRTGRLPLSAVSIVIASLYVISPSALYYSFWFFSAAFFAFLPIALASFDFALTHPPSGRFSTPAWRALILAGGMSLLATDPRGITFSIVLVGTFTLFVLASEGMPSFGRLWRTLLSGFLIYVLINLRFLLLAAYLAGPYSAFDSGIVSTQLGSNYVFFPPLDTLSGLGLFIQYVSYESLVPLSIPLIIVAFSTFLYRRAPRPTYLFAAIYLFVVLVQSNTLGLTSATFNITQETPLLSGMWLVFPMYFSEMLMAPLMLLSGFGLFFLVSGCVERAPQAATIRTPSRPLSRRLRAHRVPIVIFVVTGIVAAQLVYSSPSYLYGNYSGTYLPVDPTPQITHIAQELENSTGYNLIVGAAASYPPVTPWSQQEAVYQSYLALPNAIHRPVNFDYPSLGKVLFQFGSENIVLDTHHPPFNLAPTLQYLQNQSGLVEEYSNGSLYLFHNSFYTRVAVASGYYLDLSYPQALDTISNLNSTVVSLPFTGQTFNQAFVRGVVGYDLNITDIRALFVQPWQLNLASYARTPPLNAYDPSSYWSMLQGYYPVQANCLGINSAVSQSLSLGSHTGRYDLYAEAVTSPQMGSVTLLSSRWATTLNLTAPNNVEWFEFDNVTLSGSLTLSNRGIGTLCQLALVPVTGQDQLNANASSFLDTHQIISEYPNNQVPAFVPSSRLAQVGDGWLLQGGGRPKPDSVTYLVHPVGSLFGNPGVVSSPDQILANQYSNTVYDYVILGTNYSIAPSTSIGTTVVILNLISIVPVLALAFFAGLGRRSPNWINRNLRK